MSITEFHGFNKFFGDFQVLKGIELSVEEGGVGPPEHYFQNPQNERTKRFLDRNLH